MTCCDARRSRHGVAAAPVAQRLQQFNSSCRIALYTAYAFGWALVLVSTFAIDHFDLFGLRQTWRYARGVKYEPPVFKPPVTEAG